MPFRNPWIKKKTSKKTIKQDRKWWKGEYIISESMEPSNTVFRGKGIALNVFLIRENKMKN